MSPDGVTRGSPASCSRFTVYDLRLPNQASNKSVSPKTQKLTIEDRLLNLLRTRGALRGRQIDAHFSKVDWRKTAQFLVRKGVLSAKSVLPPPRVRSKYIRVAQLAVTPEEAESEMPNLGMKSTLARRQAALRFLIEQPEPINLSWVYAESGCNIADLNELEERGLIRLFENEIFRDPLERAGKHAQADTYTRTQVKRVYLSTCILYQWRLDE